MNKLIRHIPLVLLVIPVLCIAFYNSDRWAAVYPYFQQLYTAIPLAGLLYYAVKNRHPTYLKVVYIGLIDLCILNCVVAFFGIENWMPYTVMVIILTLILFVYFLIATNAKRTTTRRNKG